LKEIVKTIETELQKGDAIIVQLMDRNDPQSQKAVELITDDFELIEKIKKDLQVIAAKPDKKKVFREKYAKLLTTRRKKFTYFYRYKLGISCSLQEVMKGYLTSNCRSRDSQQELHCHLLTSRNPEGKTVAKVMPLKINVRTNKFQGKRVNSRNKDQVINNCLLFQTNFS
jgi:hypothetical protein